MNKFGERLKELRTERGLTQGELAQEFGIARNSIFSYETNKRTPDIDVLSKCAMFFDVTSDYLLGLSDNRKADNVVIGEELGLDDNAITLLKRYKKSIDEYNELFLELASKCKDSNAYSQVLKNIGDNEYPEKIMQKFSEKMQGKVEFDFDTGNEFELEYRNNPILLSVALNHVLSDTNLLLLIGRYLMNDYPFYPTSYQTMTKIMLREITLSHIHEQIVQSKVSHSALVGMYGSPSRQDDKIKSMYEIAYYNKVQKATRELFSQFDDNDLREKQKED